MILILIYPKNFPSRIQHITSLFPKDIFWERGILFFCSFQDRGTVKYEYNAAQRCKAAVPQSFRELKLCHSRKRMSLNKAAKCPPFGLIPSTIVQHKWPVGP